MELREENDGWHLALQDGFVQIIQIDFRLGLFLADASGLSKLYVGSACRLKGPDSEVSLIPEDTPSLAPALPLFNAKVESIDIRKTGQLTVWFDGGRTLEVEPDEKFEAWELGCSINLQFICSQGGEVAVYG